MDVPAETPVTTPVVDPAAAIAVLLLAHVPPVMASLRVIVLPVQTVLGPVTGATGFTVMVLVVEVTSPHASVAVTVYVVVVTGLTVTDEPVSPPGFHR